MQQRSWLWAVRQRVSRVKRAVQAEGTGRAKRWPAGSRQRQEGVSPNSKERGVHECKCDAFEARSARS